MTILVGMVLEALEMDAECLDLFPLLKLILVWATPVVGNYEFVDKCEILRHTEDSLTAHKICK
jgi:hypothetical protein